MTSIPALVIAQVPEVRVHLARVLISQGYEVACAESVARALARRDSPRTPAVILLDVPTSDLRRFNGLAGLKHCWPHVPVVVLSAAVDPDTVVNAMRMGAANFVAKPFKEADLERAIARAIQNKGPSERLPLDRFEYEPGEILTRNPKMRELCEVILQVADTDVPLILLGDSGVGKEVMARFLHAQSPRRRQPFVKVNCGALPAELLESELFGYERGAFTGAVRDKPGKFELADNGTILLDEISEMSPQLQVKLLHVLQDGEYTRLGATQTRHANARVVAATNQQLEQAVERKAFRSDLYFRLNVIRLEIPPLRERREDILPLVALFLKQYSDKYVRPLRPLPPEIESMLLEYPWPGNVRELENIVKRLVILADIEEAVAPLHFPVHILKRGFFVEPAAPQMGRMAMRDEPISLKRAVALAAEHTEREIIVRTLEEHNWNRKKTAHKLSISYKALLNKLHRWGIGGRSGGLGLMNGRPVDRSIVDDHKMEPRYHTAIDVAAVRTQQP